MIPIKEKRFDQLAQVFTVLKNKSEVKKFLQDLLTEQEINEFGKRLEAAKLLQQGVAYTEVEQQTGLSSTTVARVSRWLKDGRNGYKLVLQRLTKTQPKI
jgi:TrpR-related protein YerC/YecD